MSRRARVVDRLRACFGKPLERQNSSSSTMVASKPSQSNPVDSRRVDIEFHALDGTALRGWFYAAASSSEKPSPIIIMTHGFSCLKEHNLHHLAAHLQSTGIATLVYDHRCFGASAGQPRFEANPHQQISDIHDAVCFLTSSAAVLGIDTTRLGIWGYSYSGGHGIVAAALDKRIRAVAVLCPMVSGPAMIQRKVAPHLQPAMMAAVWEDRAARISGAAPAYMPIMGGPESVLPSEDAKVFFESMQSAAPDWQNRCSLQSTLWCKAYDPQVYIEAVAPTPLLMLVAEDDVDAPTDTQLAAFAMARMPKDLHVFPGGHFAAFEDGFRPELAGRIAEFYWSRFGGRA